MTQPIITRPTWTLERREPGVYLFRHLPTHEERMFVCNRPTAEERAEAAAAELEPFNSARERIEHKTKSALLDIPKTLAQSAEAAARLFTSARDRTSAEAWNGSHLAELAKWSAAWRANNELRADILAEWATTGLAPEQLSARRLAQGVLTACRTYAAEAMRRYACASREQLAWGLTSMHNLDALSTLVQSHEIAAGEHLNNLGPAAQEGN